MRWLFGIAFVIALPYLLDRVIDRQFNVEPEGFTRQEVAQLDKLVADINAHHVEKVTLFRPKNERQRLAAIADVRYYVASTPTAGAGE